VKGSIKGRSVTFRSTFLPKDRHTNVFTRQAWRDGIIRAPSRSQASAGLRLKR
jgi:hypothetical protein